MHYPRWYPDLTELPDGRYVAISGNSTNASTWADTPEVYDPRPTPGRPCRMSTRPRSTRRSTRSPTSRPNGDVFTIGPSEDKSFFLTSRTRPGRRSAAPAESSTVHRSCTGRARSCTPAATNSQNSNSPANATSAVIDLTAQSPTWQQTSPMLNARVYHTLTTLADGTVLAVGGETTCADGQHRGVRRRPAERDLEPDHQDLVARRVDLGRPAATTRPRS